MPQSLCPPLAVTGAGRLGLDAERRLFRGYRDAGDARARDALIDRFMPLARTVARRYRGATVPLRGPRADRLYEPGPRDRSLRPPARRGVLVVRGALHDGRPQAPLSRPRLVGPDAARAPGARAARGERARRAGDGHGAPRPPSLWRVPWRRAPSACSRRARRTARCTPTPSTGPSAVRRQRALAAGRARRRRHQARRAVRARGAGRAPARTRRARAHDRGPVLPRRDDAEADRPPPGPLAECTSREILREALRQLQREAA